MVCKHFDEGKHSLSGWMDTNKDLSQLHYQCLKENITNSLEQT